METKPRKLRDTETGQFVMNGGREAVLHDKPCLDCGKLILRRSTYCRSCSQKGSRSVNFKHGKFNCEMCGKIKRHPKLCLDCFHKIHVGVNHPLFKLEDYTYSTLHDWVRRHKGKPLYCSINPNHIGRIVWANISGEYKRDLTDWHSLCNSCNLNDGVHIPVKYYKELNKYES